MTGGSRARRSVESVEVPGAFARDPGGCEERPASRRGKPGPLAAPFAHVIGALSDSPPGRPERRSSPLSRAETKGDAMSAVQAPTDIRPFQIDVPEEKLDDLRRRIAATRWPSSELVGDRSQGVQLQALQALTRYWLGEYDFG